MKLSREAIERLLGPQPTAPKILPPKPDNGWYRMTKEERQGILNYVKANPSFSYNELSKKFRRAPSVIWKLCKDAGLKNESTDQNRSC